MRPHSEKHTRALSVSIKSRLGALWSQVDEESAMRCPNSGLAVKREDEETISASAHESCRVLLFHIGSLLDLSECQIKFIDPIPLARDEYIRVLRRAIIQEAVELDSVLKDLSGKSDGISS